MRRKGIRIALFSVLFVACGAAAVLGTGKGASHAEAKAALKNGDVLLDRVPDVVVIAADEAVAGIELTGARLRTKRSGVTFTLTGVRDGRQYRLKVDAAGKVLGVKEHKAKRARANGGAKADGTAKADTRYAGPARRVGFIRHAAVRESSGLVASRRFPDVFWTHNDKGNAPVLYAIDRTGALLAEFHVNASHDDWEDVAADGDGNLYVGNIGNNDAARKWLEVHRLAEPDPTKPAGGRRASLRPDKTWRLTFPAAPFDCESLFVHGGHGYVVSKVFDGKPAKVYRFPLAAEGEVALEEVATLPTDAPVTAADLSPDGERLVVLTYGRLYTFEVGGDVACAGSVAPRVVEVPPLKLEGASFAREGILISSEGRELYFLPPSAGPATAGGNDATQEAR